MIFSKIRLKIYGISFIIFFSQVIFAKNYFQQQVNYKIDVKLNDSTHTLHAHETIEYINHSEDALEFVYFHLWPNSYQKNSALDKQLMADGDTKLHFAKLKDKGFIDSLNFTSNSQKLRWEYDAKHHDICKIFLPKPLLPNETIEISTPFFVKIPSAKLSRLGRIGQFYAITQWYPKPAVYDVDGWHQMPYLNQGEFYSEFGSFDVRITLPENYVVGATGDLQTQSEIDFLNEKSSDTTTIKKQEGKLANTFPTSSKKFKTIRYTQQNVHDFGWFADKRFIVKKSEVKLPHSGNTVITWAMFTPSNAKSWKKATQYINDAVYYYSKWNGDYPYKHCTAIDGTISAGGGMEYPNITIINSTADSLQMDIVITHEVGHNWFYGILGSNERLHPWMDEGINSFNEMRYVKTKYPNLNLPRMVAPSKTSQNIIGLKKLPGSYFNFYSYWITAKYNADQPIELPSEEFTSSNYGQIVYQKTAASFNLLYSYLGAEMFDSCMHNYFNQWKFKHPQPADIRAVFENTTSKNLAWFFDDVIGTTKKSDYMISSSSYDSVKSIYNITLKNFSSLLHPVKISAVKKNIELSSFWVDSLSNKISLNFNSPELDYIAIDKDLNSLDAKPSNNVYKLGDSSNYNHSEFHFFPHLSNNTKSEIFVVPVLGVNSSNSIMEGIYITNAFFPTPKFSYSIMPMYSNMKKYLCGTYRLNYNFYKRHFYKRLSIGIIVKDYFVYDANWNRKSAYVEYVLPKNDKRKTSSTLILQHTLLRKNYDWLYYEAINNVTEFSYVFNFTGAILKSNIVVNADLLSNSGKAESRVSVKEFSQITFLREIKNNARLSFELNNKIRYSKAKDFRFRLFAGKLFSGSNKTESVMNSFGYSFNGFNDIMFNDTYVQRENNINLYMNDGALSNIYFPMRYLCVPNLISLNTSIDIINGGIIALYSDFALSKSVRYLTNTIGDVTYSKPQDFVFFDFGIKVALIKDMVEFRFPLYIKGTNINSSGPTKLFNNVGILINLTKLNPFDAARKAYD